MSVKFLDLKKQYETIDINKTMSYIREAIENGMFVGGSHVESFETSLAAFSETKYSVGVGSGTDALIFALAGLGIGPGDEVVVPANTFIATALAVTHVGAKPVFADVDENTYLLTVKNIEAVLTEKTKAIMPVHLYGNVVNMSALMTFAKAHNLFVVEDCAQAIGARYNNKPVGSFGDAGCFSFYPAKNLGGLGQGGAIVTNNEAIVAKARCLGNVGRKEGSWYEYSDIGYNSRLDAVNAIFLAENLNHIEDWNRRRRLAASYYAKFFNAIPEVVVPFSEPEALPVYHLYEIKLNNKETRDKLQDYLKARDIGAALHYPVPCHKQEVYSTYKNQEGLRNSEILASTLLSLPMHPFITIAEIEEVCKAIKKFFL